MCATKRLENTTTLFLRKREFGFICPAFSMGMSGDGFLLPRFKRQLLKRSLLPIHVATRDLTGRYTLEIHHNGAEYCKIAVIVAWASHKSFRLDAFLAMKVREPLKLRSYLRPLEGKQVELTFRPRLAPHLLRPVNLRR
jgi:hypothetical protein